MNLAKYSQIQQWATPSFEFCETRTWACLGYTWMGASPGLLEYRILGSQRGMIWGEWHPRWQLMTSTSHSGVQIWVPVTLLLIEFLAGAPGEAALVSERSRWSLQFLAQSLPLQLLTRKPTDARFSLYLSPSLLLPFPLLQISTSLSFLKKWIWKTKHGWWSMANICGMPIQGQWAMSTSYTPSGAMVFSKSYSDLKMRTKSCGVIRSTYINRKQKRVKFESSNQAENHGQK